LTQEIIRYFKGLVKMPLFWAKWDKMSIAARETLCVVLLSTEFSTASVDIPGGDFHSLR